MICARTDPPPKVAPEGSRESTKLYRCGGCEKVRYGVIDPDGNEQKPGWPSRHNWWFSHGGGEDRLFACSRRCIETVNNVNKIAGFHASVFPW